jgi:hypothetical protein
MVRYAKPLVVAPALPSLNRLEVLIAESRLHHSPVGLNSSEEASLTVLLSFDPTDVERRAARVLAESFIAAACSFEQAPGGFDAGTWLKEILHGLPPSWACIVIALPEYDAELERELQAFLAFTRKVGRHYVSLVVGIATAPADWSGCALDGFVIVEPEQRVTGALQVFSMLAAVMAPGLMCCLDAHDFWSAFGTAANPSQIAQAVYMPGSSRFVPASRIDLLILNNAAGVAVMPSRSLRLMAQSRLVANVRACARPNAMLTIVVPFGLTVEPLGSGRSVDVLLLCRKTSKIHADLTSTLTQ